MLIGILYLVFSVLLFLSYKVFDVGASPLDWGRHFALGIAMPIAPVMAAHHWELIRLPPAYVPAGAGVVFIGLALGASVHSYLEDRYDRKVWFKSPKHLWVLASVVSAFLTAAALR